LITKTTSTFSNTVKLNETMPNMPRAIFTEQASIETRLELLEQYSLFMDVE
jgi:hypothetical protein